MDNIKGKFREQKNGTREKKSSTKAIAIAAMAVILFLAICATFAWFTNKISYVNGKLILGNFSTELQIYSLESNGSVTTLVDQTATDEDINVQNVANESGWASNQCGYRFFKITNHSGIDIKSYINASYNTNMSDEDLAYFHYRIIDVTQLVNNSSLSFTSWIQNWSDKPDAAAIKESGHVFSSLTSDNYMGTAVKDGGSKYYCLAFCCYNYPSNELDVNTYLQINSSVISKQINAPDAETSDNGNVYYVSAWEMLVSTVNSVRAGDTVYLSSDIESPADANLTFLHRANLDLNDHSLTIHGDLNFDYTAKGKASIVADGNSYLRLDGDLNIDTPSTDFEILGTGGSPSVIIGNGHNFYANCNLVLNGDSKSADTDSGLYLNNITVSQDDGSGTVTVADLTVGSHTLVKVGASSTIGVISSESSSTYMVYIENYGKISKINLSQMMQRYNNGTVEVYIRNRNSFTGSGSVIALPDWALGAIEDPTYYNTYIANAAGADTSWVTLDTSAAQYFTEQKDFQIANIKNEGEDSESVVRLGVNKYQVNKKSSTDTIEALLNAYFSKHTELTTESISTITYLEINTYDATVSTNDFSFIKSNMDVSTLDLTDAVMASSTIPAAAMTSEASLQTLYLPKANTAIGANAFKDTNIGKLTLSDNITSIGSTAFAVAGDNYDTHGKIFVYWDSMNTISTSFLSGFSSSTAVLFMSASQVTAMKSTSPYSSVTNAWRSCFIETPDFQSGDYFCKIENVVGVGNACKILYYNGVIADGQELVPDYISYGSSNYSISSIGQQAFRNAIKAHTLSDSVSITLPETCTSVEDEAFSGYNSYALTVTHLDLGGTTYIGQYAFSYQTIQSSAERPSGWTGLTYLGAYAFGNSSLYSGILDVSGAVSGTENSMCPENNTFYSFAAAGTSVDSTVVRMKHYTSLTNTILNSATFTDCTLDLTGVTSIEASTLSNKIKTVATSADAMVGKVILTDVLNINSAKSSTATAAPLYNIQCDVLQVGIQTVYTDQASVNENCTYYHSIYTYGTLGINHFILDGLIPDDTSTSNNYAFGSYNQGAVIGKLTVTENCSRIPSKMFLSNTSGKYLTIGSAEFDSADYSVGASAFSYITISGALNLSHANAIEENAFLNSAVNNTDSENTSIEIGSTTIGSAAFNNVTLTGIESLQIGTNSTIETTAFAALSSTDLKTIKIGAGSSLAVSAFDKASMSAVTKLDLSGVSSVGNYCFRGVPLSNGAVVDVRNIPIMGYASFAFATGQQISQFIIGVDSDKVPSEFKYGAGGSGTSANGIFCYSTSEVPTLTFSKMEIVGELPPSGSHGGLAGTNNIVTIDTLQIDKGCSAITTEIFYSQYKTTAKGTVINNVTTEDGASFTIESNAFRYVQFGSSILDFEGVVSVGANAFNGSTLVKLNLGSKITEFTRTALTGCTNLEFMRITKADAIVTAVGTGTFPVSTAKIYVPADLVTSYTGGTSTTNDWYTWRTYFVADALISGDWAYTYLSSAKTDIELTEYLGTETAVSIPSTVDGHSVTQIGGNCFLTNVATSVTISASVQFIDPDALSSTAITSISVDASNSYYSAASNVLYNKDQTTLVRYLPGLTATTFKLPDTVTTILSGAFEGTAPKTIELRAVSTIGTGAFDNSSAVTFISLYGGAINITSNDAFGTAKKNATVDNDPVYTTSISITVPQVTKSAYESNNLYSEYISCGCITYTSTSPIATVSDSVDELTMLEAEVDGISYMLMDSGTTYGGVTFTSDSGESVAVVTDINDTLRACDTVVIPASVSDGGIVYEVVGIADGAFADCTELSKLVIPTGQIYYTSLAFTGCTNLGYIQCSDVVPYNLSNIETAALPSVSASSMLDEAISKDDDE